MDVDSKLLDGLRVKPFCPRGHNSAAAIADGLCDRGLVAGIEPKLISEVRRAELGIALAVGAVAGGAIGGEDLCSALNDRLVFSLAGKGKDL